jgi:hypothetical protein
VLFQIRVRPFSLLALLQGMLTPLARFQTPAAKEISNHERNKHGRERCAACMQLLPSVHLRPETTPRTPNTPCLRLGGTGKRFGNCFVFPWERRLLVFDGCSRFVAILENGLKDVCTVFSPELVRTFLFGAAPTAQPGAWCPDKGGTAPRGPFARSALSRDMMCYAVSMAASLLMI